MQKVSLEGVWKLRPEFIDLGIDHINEVLSREDGEFHFTPGRRPFPTRSGYMNANVPCDVITPLMENGIMEDPVLKTNSEDSLFTKDYSWWFIRDFEVSDELYANEEVRLFIEMLDYNADIAINGVPKFKHKNAFVPLYENIKPYIKPGKNQIVIRLTSGVETRYPNDSLTFYNATQQSEIDTRTYMRKPQFTYGWDWCKNIPTCGIGRQIYLEGVTGAKISSFRADTLCIKDGGATLDMFFELDDIGNTRSGDAVLTYRLKYDGETVFEKEKELYIYGGFNAVHDIIEIKDAKLWWPNGYGEQCLYTVEAEITYRGVTNAMEPKKIGIRTIEIDHTKIPGNGRNFRFVVNGVGIFCSGGNWVPTDSVYMRVPDSKYKTLVEEAKESNFTMLRMWGGGMYEPDCFYDYCSENGILLMHDFMYSCAYEPDYDDAFLYEAIREADYQTKRLAHFACMAIWTGNNEVSESYNDWIAPDALPPYNYGMKIFNYIQPEAVYRNSPKVFYMPSSPFGGEERANDMSDGDTHIWKPIAKERAKMGMTGFGGFHYGKEMEIFDNMAAQLRFSSEYGFHGAPRYSSVVRYHDGEPVEFGDEIMEHHGEMGGKKGFRATGIENFLHSTENMDVKEFLMYNSLAQGLQYWEMATAIRRRRHCSGDLIWMYNDCWPETGWTTIDYFCTRKVSYYLLKRAFAFRQAFIRVFDKKAYMTFRNDNPNAACLKYAYGYTAFDGKSGWEKEAVIELKPFDFVELPPFDAPEKPEDGVYYIKPLDDIGFAMTTSSRSYYRDYNIAEGSIRSVDIKRDGKDLIVTVENGDVYVPFVNIECEDDRTHMEDNFFEMLPGQKRSVRVFDCDKEPEVKLVKVSKGDHSFRPEIPERFRKMFEKRRKQMEKEAAKKKALEEKKQ